MFIYSNTKMLRGCPVGLGGIAIDNAIYTLVKSAVWDTENNYFGFRFPTLVITAFTDNPDSKENRDGYCEYGINEFSAANAIVYRFSPRDMLATLNYLESENPEALPDDDDQILRLCEYFTNHALIETRASKPIQGQMYGAVLAFFRDAYRRREKYFNE